MLDYSAPSTVPTLTDTISESCCRDLSNDALFGTDTLGDVEQSSFENRSRGCVILCHPRYTQFVLIFRKGTQKAKLSASSGCRSLTRLVRTLRRYLEIKRERETRRQKEERQGRQEPPLPACGLPGSLSCPSHRHPVNTKRCTHESTCVNKAGHKEKIAEQASLVSSKHQSPPYLTHWTESRNMAMTMTQVVRVARGMVQLSSW